MLQIQNFDSFAFMLVFAALLVVSILVYYLVSWWLRVRNDFKTTPSLGNHTKAEALEYIRLAQKKKHDQEDQESLEAEISEYEETEFQEEDNELILNA